VARDLDKTKFDVTVVSPRNHFLFTPLLPSTTVGTLEFRCVQEPVRTIKGVHYLQAQASGIDFEGKQVHCTEVYAHREEVQPGSWKSQPKAQLSLPYDKLVIATGTKSNTFGVPGITSQEEAGEISPSGTSRHNVFFLKQLEHARAIRNRIIECFERASSPSVSEAERRRLLTFVVVGGGPTSIEFTSELYDFLTRDVSLWYPDLATSHSVTLVEAGKHLLGSFDETLSNYVERKFKRRHIRLLTGESVRKVRGNSVELSSGTVLNFGVCVWSTGNSPLDFIKQLGLEMSRQGRILVGPSLKVSGREDVYALGDCAEDRHQPLGMLAQVANQQGKHLANSLNSNKETGFKYQFLGSMAQLGTWDAVVDMGAGSKGTVSGLAAFVAWRSAYWGYQVSLTNKLLIPMYWFKSFWFGRDISKF